MTLPSEGLVDPLDRVRDRARAEGEERGMGTGSSGPASPRSVNSAPCGLEDHRTGASRLGLALPLGLTHSSPTGSPQRMEWKVNDEEKCSRHFLSGRAQSLIAESSFCFLNIDYEAERNRLLQNSNPQMSWTNPHSGTRNLLRGLLQSISFSS